MIDVLCPAVREHNSIVDVAQCVKIASRRSGVARRRKRHRSNGGGSNAVGSNTIVATMARGSW